MADAAELARQRAEARRQKILARQKDRLQTITGNYAESPVAEEPRAMDKVETDAGPAAKPLAAPEGVGLSSDERQHLEGMLAVAASSLSRAQEALDQTADAGAGPHSQHPGSALQVQEGLRQRRQQQQQQQIEECPVQPGHPSTSGHETPASLPSVSSPGSPVRLGQALSAAVQGTQLLRLLLSAALAYVAVSGLLDFEELQVRPILALWLGHFILIVSWAAVMAYLRPAAVLKGLESQRDMLPRQLRQLNLVALVPGLQEILDVVSGYQQFAAALSVDAAAFLVSTAMLMSGVK